MHTLDRSQLRGRYRIIGDIVMDTALHIGGHGTSTITDSPIIRNGDNQPFIPGSSLKGAFRAAVERIVPNIPRLRTCGLADTDESCARKLRDETKDRRLDEQEPCLDYSTTSFALSAGCLAPHIWLPPHCFTTLR